MLGRLGGPEQGRILLREEHDHGLAGVGAGTGAGAGQATQDRLDPLAILIVVHGIAEVGQLDAELPSEAVPLGDSLDAAEARFGAGRHLAPHLESRVVAMQCRGSPGAAGHHLGRLIERENQP